MYGTIRTNNAIDIVSVYYIYRKKLKYCDYIVFLNGACLLSLIQFIISDYIVIKNVPWEIFMALCLHEVHDQFIQSTYKSKLPCLHIT